MTTEQIRMLATALNNFGVGVLLASIVVPVVNGQTSSIAWYVFGIVWIAVAQLVIGELQ